MAEQDDVAYEWIVKFLLDLLKPQDIVDYLIVQNKEISQHLQSKKLFLDTKWPNCNFEDDVIAVFEKFIFYPELNDCYDGYSGDNSICGKVFSLNEIYYRCNECEVYGSRPLCIGCFENSPHKTHKYTICKSEERESCRCGEMASWEVCWCCISCLGNNEKYINDEGLKCRVGIVMEAIFIFVQDVFTGTTQSENDDDMVCLILDGDIDGLPNVPDLICLLRYMNNKIKDAEMLSYVQSMVQEKRITLRLPSDSIESFKAEAEAEDFIYKARIVDDNQVVYEELAYRLLLYIEKCLKYGKDFREIFTKVVTERRNVAEQIFKLYLNNVPDKLQIICHKLLMLGTMREYKSQTILAEMIIDKYDNIIQSIFGQDLFDALTFTTIKNHLFSIFPLSQSLISQKSAMWVLLKSLKGEIMKNYGNFKNLNKDEEYNMNALWRTTYILRDLKDLLGVVPKFWTNKLRQRFTKSIVTFLEVLNILQDMDGESRATGEHVEFEQDYVSAYEIQFYLVTIVDLVLKWCNTNEKILILVFKKTVEKLNENTLTCRNKTTDKVSIHLPLTRFLAGLCVCLENRGLLMKTSKFEAFSITFIYKSILDPVLRVQAMIAQVAAGMWNRNGTPMRERINCYRDVDYRTEMHDRDIQLLQIAASCIESNQFIIQLLEKFDLVKWLLNGLNEDESMEEVICIAEHFFQLLITVVIERYVPGVSYISSENCLKYEIIHQLCIGPSTYSEIYNSIPMELTRNGFSKVLDKVATLKEPSVANKSGTYELRKECFQCYNPLFYHYTSNQRSVAEEFQRQRRKAAKETDYFEPAVLPKLKESFQSIVDILQCEAMLQIIQIVLDRSITDLSISNSSTLIETMLYLIGHSLQEEATGNYPTFNFTEKATEWNIFSRLENLLSKERQDVPNDLLKWIIQKYYEVAGLSKIHIEEPPLSYSSKESEKKLRAKLAALKRTKIMNEMAEMQKKFLISNEHDQSDIDLSETDLDDTYTCILCQGSTKSNLQNEVLVSPAFVQLSRILCDNREIVAVSGSLILSSNLGPAFYTSSCGHIMHYKCLKVHIDVLWEKEQEKPYLSKPGFDMNREEFLCPLCQSLSNVVLPLLPQLSSIPATQINLDNELEYVIGKFNDKFNNKTLQCPFQLWKSLAYTIHTIENVLTNSNKSILGQLSSRHQDCLERFVRVAVVTKNLFYIDRTSYDWNIQQLNLFLRGKSTEMDTHLNCDIFSLLVTLTFSKFNMLQTTDFHTFRLIFVAQIVKILITTQFGEMVDNVETEQCTPFNRVLQLFGNKFVHLGEDFVWSYVQEVSLPFLRCCVLFYRFLRDVSPSPVLTELQGNTFSNMCEYLKLPQTREELFHIKDVYPIVYNWMQHFNVKKHLIDGNAIYETDPCHINQLVSLPNEYRELITAGSLCRCPNNYEKAATDPVICLVCGEILCTGSCCCTFVKEHFKTALYLHYENCSNEIYLKIETCEILFTPRSGSLACTLPGPYLDHHYETYVNSRPENGLYFSSRKYKELQTLWLGHDIIQEVSSHSRRSIQNEDE